VTALARPFWQGTHEHELRLQRCAPVASFSFPPQVLCRRCLAEEHDWTPTSGRATVTASWCSIAGDSGFADDVPYVVAVVELDEGPLMLTNIVGCTPDGVRVRHAGRGRLRRRHRRDHSVPVSPPRDVMSRRRAASADRV